jgi:hypothetical protein
VSVYTFCSVSKCNDLLNIFALVALSFFPSYTSRALLNHLTKSSTMAAHSPAIPSLTTDVMPISEFIFQPIAILAIVIFASISYKRCRTLDVSPETRQLFINFHAVTTELCQLVLVILAPLKTTPVISEIILLVGGNHITAGKAALIIQILVVSSLLFHSAAIVMVDIVEGWILLGNGADSLDYQLFLITRNCLVSLWRHFTKRTTPEPPELLMPRHVIQALEIRRQNRAALHTRLAKLYHLDLAGSHNFRGWSLHAYKLSIVAAPTPMLTPSRKAQRHAFEDLPTPPDSNELRETRRVNWAPTVTVFSSSGVERRGSMP